MGLSVQPLRSRREKAEGLNPCVWIIVLNWNGRHHLQDCLGSLSTVDYPNYKILFVDNASSDGSVDFVKENYSAVMIIRNENNLGFAEGNNVGIRHALDHGADYVVLLNNDTRVEPDFLSELIRRSEENKGVGVLGGKILMSANPRTVNSTGVNLNLFAYGWDRDFGEDATELKREGGEVLAVSGCMMAVKKEVFEAVGFFDPKYFAYYEDVDFCIRVWKHTKFKIEYVPGSVIYHKFSASSSPDPSFKRRLMTINRYRLFFKHFPAREIAKIFPLMTLHRGVMIFGHLIKLDFRLFMTELMILLKNWALLPFTIISRNREGRRGVDATFFNEKIIHEMNRPTVRKDLLKKDRGSILTMI